MNNDFFRHEWGEWAIIFTSDESHHELPQNRYSRWRMYYTISYTLFYFLNAQVRYKQLSIADCRQKLFSDLVLWRHHSWSGSSRQRGVWHCDLIFVDCFFTCKLAQRRSSLENCIDFPPTDIHGLACKNMSVSNSYQPTWLSNRS